MYFSEEEKINKDLWKVSINSTSVSHMVKSGKGDLHCFTTNDRPIVFSCFFFDEFKNICKGTKSVILILNNRLIPHLDLSEETNLEHYYEMYLRYVDFLYGSFTTNHHEKLLSVLSYDEFCLHPIYFFILPKIKETGHYDIKLKIVFEKQNNKIEDIFYMYNYINSS